MHPRRLAAAATLVSLAAGALFLAGTAGASGGSAGWRYCPPADAYRSPDCADPPALPDSPAGRQLGWALDHLGGGAATLTEDEVATHYSADYLAQVAPASAVVDQFRRSLNELGTLSYQGMSFPPRADQAVGLVGTGSGEQGAVGVSVDGDGRIESLLVQPAGPTIVPRGRYSGLFDVGGRQMFLRCTGTGSPTVVFELGLTTDWATIHHSLSPTTHRAIQRDAHPHRWFAEPLRMPGNDRGEAR
jgi:uncharacterized protein